MTIPKCKKTISGDHNFEFKWIKSGYNDFEKIYVPVCIYCGLIDDTKETK
jgi:hypothetical protein